MYLLQQKKIGTKKKRKKEEEERKKVSKLAGQLLIPCPLPGDVWWPLPQHITENITGYMMPVGLTERTATWWADTAEGGR